MERSVTFVNVLFTKYTKIFCRSQYSPYSYLILNLAQPHILLNSILYS
jgi:hypothetical protein